LYLILVAVVYFAIMFSMFDLEQILILMQDGVLTSKPKPIPVLFVFLAIGAVEVRNNIIQSNLLHLPGIQGSPYTEDSAFPGTLSNFVFLGSIFTKNNQLPFSFYTSPILVGCGFRLLTRGFSKLVPFRFGAMDSLPFLVCCLSNIDDAYLEVSPTVN